MSFMDALTSNKSLINFKFCRTTPVTLIKCLGWHVIHLTANNTSNEEKSKNEILKLMSINQLMKTTSYVSTVAYVLFPTLSLYLFIKFDSRKRCAA